MEETTVKGSVEAVLNGESDLKESRNSESSSEVNTNYRIESDGTILNQHPTHHSAGDAVLDRGSTLEALCDASLNTNSNLEASIDEALNEPSCVNEDMSLEELYNRFSKAKELDKIMESFAELANRVQLTHARGFALYVELKSKLGKVWKAIELFDLLDKRARQKEYKQQTAAQHRRVLIVGAGPIGLRTALDCAFLGCDVVVVEKRRAFTRNNVLHLWPFTIRDLRELGAKKFFGKFCAGAIDHVSIRTLQCILLKLCLLLGVTVHVGVEFDTILEPDHSMGWHANFKPPDHAVNQFDFECIVCADGRKSSIQGFEKTELRGKLALAITANFVNYGTSEEAACSEISGVAFIFNQQFFKDLKQDTGVDLENIVYYRDDTHYFVMTAKKESLISKGVLLSEYPETKQLLDVSNINYEKLCQYAEEAAAWSTHLPKLDFALNHHHNADVALFDFTSIHAAKCAARACRRNGKDLILCLAGDSLLEPFWPKGTGCGQGFLSAMDTAWMIQGLGEGKHIIELLCERESVYQLLAQTTPEKLHQSLDKYTINPATRYTNLNLQQVKPDDVIMLYDTGNEPVPIFEPRPHKALTKTLSAPATNTTKEDAYADRNRTSSQIAIPKLRHTSEATQRWARAASQLKARPVSLFNIPTTGVTSEGTTMAGWGSETSEYCYFCGKRVYLMERIVANGVHLHRNCFRCAHCRTQLAVGGYGLSKAEGTEKAKFFCTAHYMQIFKSNPRALNYSRTELRERSGSSTTILEEPSNVAKESPEVPAVVQKEPSPVPPEPQVSEVQVQPPVIEAALVTPAEPSLPAATSPIEQSPEEHSYEQHGWFCWLCCCCCCKRQRPRH